MSEHWVLGANDNDWVGWTITVAYFVAAALCFICGRRTGAVRRGSEGRERWLWWCVGAALLLLGINKQLDLQTPLRTIGRALAEAEGWYASRRTVQWIVIGGGMLGGFWVLGWLWQRGRQAADWSLPLALLGMALLLVFVAVRAAPARADKVLGIRHPVPGKRHMLELGAIACVAIAAGKGWGRAQRVE